MRSIHTPKLRFNQFKDDWKQNKIRDIYNVNTGKSKYIREDNGKYKVLGSVGVVGKSKSYDYSGKYVLIARVGAYAGSIYMYSGKVKITDNTIFINTDSYMFAYLLLKHKNLSNLVFGSGQPLIKSSELKNLDIKIPKSEKEQEQIGLFFNKIDNLINLKVNKIANLEHIKKGYSQNLFDDQNECKSKIRFEEFNDIWNEFKFGKIIEKNKMKNKDDKYSLVESVSNANGFVKQDRQFKDRKVASNNLKNYYVITENTFAYNPSRINVGSIAYKKTGEETSLVSPLYISFKTDNSINDGFIWYWIKSEIFKKQRSEFSEGGVRETLSFEQLSNFRINIPSIEEQQRISNLFNVLNNEIKLQKQELDHLKSLKKGYLQKMFI